jgi:pimeloyl-ACP methyl ester carboxylesterase
MNHANRLFCCIITPALVACAPIAALKETRIRSFTVLSTDARLLSAQEDLTDALRCERRDPLKALECSLNAVEDASLELQSDPGDKEARRVYNFALERVFGIIRNHEIDPWTQPLKVGGYTLKQHNDPRPGRNASLYEMIPDDQLKIDGKYFTNRVTRDGIGASLVSIRKEKKIDFQKNFGGGAHTYYGVTAVARFKGKECEVEFYNPLDVESVKLGQREFPLAADFSSPFAMLLTRERPQKLGLARLINPGKYAETARIARLRPYDPERIPLLLVHGLMDTHATWMPMLNGLREDPVIRKHYQIWIYTYPSGYPYPYSASLLRAELDKVAKVYPDHKPIVYMGHSMGGMIGRLMLTDSGDTIWKNSFSQPPESIDLPAADLQMMKDMLIFKHRSDLSRAIFICAPHRGAKMAAGLAGRIGTRLVKAPEFLLDVGDTLKHALTLDKAGYEMKRIPSSIDTLSTENKFVKAVNTLPLAPGIPYHTIVGDRGKGDTPESSDGFVPYTSSHLDGAESELIVDSNHSGHQNPQAIAEVIRILKLHIKK